MDATLQYLNLKYPNVYTFDEDGQLNIVVCR